MYLRLRKITNSVNRNKMSFIEKRDENGTALAKKTHANLAVLSKSF